MAALAAVAHAQTRTVYDKPLDDSYRLRITATYSENKPGYCCSTSLQVLLIDNDNANRSWTIAVLPDDLEIIYKVQRADAGSVVLSREDAGYGMDHGSLKLFFDTASRRLLKRIDYETSQPLRFSGDAEAARRLRVNMTVARLLRRRGVLGVPEPNPVAEQLPEPFEAHPLPQSTYREFARARPARVRDGNTADETTFEERIGPYQEQGGRLWFGKSFYDAEGLSGIGGVGYLAVGRYTMLPISELVDWSVSSLLVEDGAVWAGRVMHGEGAAHSGGLIRFDRETKRVRLYDVPDVIHAIVHTSGALFLGTNHGVYVIRGGTTIRYRTEPDINGRWIVVSEILH